MDYGVVGFGARQQDLVTQLVRLNQVATQIAQGVSGERFAARETPRESYAEHRCRSAALTVLAMSMAMVNGPTPPGTGVYAPANSRTASGSTSPINFPSAVRFMPTSITVAPG